MTKVPEMFGSMVFNDKVMRERLPKATYKALKKTVENGEPLDEGVANFMANAGIPMPKGVKIEKQGGLLQRIIEALTPQKVINKTSQKMKKTFKFICAILLLEAMSFEENKTALTDEQVQKIEDEMARLNAENTQANEDLASRDQTIASLQAQLEELRKKPAEEPVNVVDDSKKTVNNDFYRNVDEAQKLFNQTF